MMPWFRLPMSVRIPCLLHLADGWSHADGWDLVNLLPGIETQSKPYYAYMTAGASKFLRICYGRVKKYLARFQKPKKPKVILLSFIRSALLSAFKILWSNIISKQGWPSKQIQMQYLYVHTFLHIFHVSQIILSLLSFQSIPKYSAQMYGNLLGF